MQTEIQKDLEKVFDYLGLDNKSVQFYLSCLTSGTNTINKISKEINIPRSTCYLILEKLKNTGVIFETPFGRKRTLVAETPENLINLLREKNKQLQNTLNLAEGILPVLNSLQSISGKPKVRFYEGIESIKQIYFETLKEAKEILIFCLTQTLDSNMKKFIDDCMRKVIKTGIKTREIVSDSKDDLEYKNKFSTANNKIVSISQKFNTDTDYMIWNNKVAYISYVKNNPIGVVIEDKEIVKFEKMRFELLWNFIAKNKNKSHL